MRGPLTALAALCLTSAADAQSSTRDWRPEERTVIGVVPDLKMEGIGDNDGETPDGFYLPLSQRCPGFVREHSGFPGI